jgi:hypothetical protein
MTDTINGPKQVIKILDSIKPKQKRVKVKKTIKRKRGLQG